MESQHSPFPRDERTNKPQGQEPKSDVAPEMDMKDVVLQSEQEGNDLERVLWIVYVIGLGTTVPCQVDHRAENSLTLKILADCNQITLDAAVRRGIWA